jgi:spore germination protein GerM
MYINKVIFMEYYEIENLDTKYDSQVVQRTDYGTTEILADTIQDLIADLESDNAEEYNFTKEELLEDLNNSLGTDVTELLLNDGLDFILVV